MTSLWLKRQAEWPLQVSQNGMVHDFGRIVNPTLDRCLAINRCTQWHGHAVPLFNTPSGAQDVNIVTFAFVRGSVAHVTALAHCLRVVSHGHRGAITRTDTLCNQAAFLGANHGVLPEREVRGRCMLHEIASATGLQHHPTSCLFMLEQGVVSHSHQFNQEALSEECVADSDQINAMLEAVSCLTSSQACLLHHVRPSQ